MDEDEGRRATVDAEPGKMRDFVKIGPAKSRPVRPRLGCLRQGGCVDFLCGTFWPIA